MLPKEEEAKSLHELYSAAPAVGASGLRAATDNPAVVRLRGAEWRQWLRVGTVGHFAVCVPLANTPPLPCVFRRRCRVCSTAFAVCFRCLCGQDTACAVCVFHCLCGQDTACAMCVFHSPRGLDTAFPRGSSGGSHRVVCRPPAAKGRRLDHWHLPNFCGKSLPRSFTAPAFPCVCIRCRSPQCQSPVSTQLDGLSTRRF